MLNEITSVTRTNVMTCESTGYIVWGVGGLFKVAKFAVRPTQIFYTALEFAFSANRMVIWSSAGKKQRILK